MQDSIILEKLKNIENYCQPHNPIVQGIICSNSNPHHIVKELSEMLEDNFLKTKEILGKELTDLVLRCESQFNVSLPI
jgi:hypothetical protein